MFSDSNKLFILQLHECMQPFILIDVIKGSRSFPRQSLPRQSLPRQFISPTITSPTITSPTVTFPTITSPTIISKVIFCRYQCSFIKCIQIKIVDCKNQMGLCLWSAPSTLTDIKLLLLCYASMLFNFITTFIVLKHITKRN